LSIKTSRARPRAGRFERVFWVVLDGMGREHVRLASGRFPSLSRIEREGFIGPSRPSMPVCQTPPALLALFAGAEPAQSGVWGYRMPDPARAGRSVSGFHAPPGACRTIWADMDAAGARYSLMNVAFRNDPVWSAAAARLDFACDAYRLWNRPVFLRLDGRRQEHEYRGIAFHTAPRGRGLALWRGSALRGLLEPGRAGMFTLTRGCSALAQLLDPALLVLCPPVPVMLRGCPPPAPTGAARWSECIDADAFRACRRLNRGRGQPDMVSVETEMLLASLSMQQKADMMVAACGDGNSRLVAGYFPLVDEFNHAYLDLLDAQGPEGRTAGVFQACMGLVDQLLGRLMAAAGPGTLLVVSSDHGAMPHRSVLHLNERLAEAGLVRRAPAARGVGYDLAGSCAFYHPSNCGQVVWNPGVARKRGVGRQEIVRRVRAVVDSAGIGMQEGGPGDPYLAFLFPLGDAYFTGSPPRPGRPALDAGAAGGQHLSPLSPTPWMDAVLGLWHTNDEEGDSRVGATGGFASGATDAYPSLPAANVQLKDFILSHLGLDGKGDA
jgi:hypothetical protein